MSHYSEDTLVQQTTAEYLERELRWESVYAHNQETFGPEGTLGRASYRETVRRVRERPADYQSVTKRPNCHRVEVKHATRTGPSI